MEEFKINKDRVFEGATDLEKELYNFLIVDESHTLSRWLLTLTKGEVGKLAVIADKAMGDVDTADDTDDEYLLPLMILIHNGYTTITVEEYTRKAMEYSTAILLIDLVKKGILTYKMAKDDVEWLFDMPDNIKKEVIKNNNGD